jgi:hypothetical protein
MSYTNVDLPHASDVDGATYPPDIEAAIKDLIDRDVARDILGKTYKYKEDVYINELMMYINNT